MEDLEQKDSQLETTASTLTPPQLDPNDHLLQFLTENNYELVTNALTEKTPYLAQHGFVLTDRPLLVISCRKKEDHAKV